jgi:thiol-disulfide isomerase/thioredoxin
VVGLLLLAFVATGCSSLQGTGDKGYVTGDGQVREIAAADRGDAVELSGVDLAGNALSLEQFRGRPVVVVVWWSGCGPCIKEAPELVALATEYADRAQFVGINIRDASPAQAQAFERKFAVPYPSFYAPNGNELLAFERRIGPQTVPAFVVLDVEGRIASSIIGEMGSPTTLSALIDTALGESPASSTDSSGPSTGGGLSDG